MARVTVRRARCPPLHDRPRAYLWTERLPPHDVISFIQEILLHVGVRLLLPADLAHPRWYGAVVLQLNRCLPLVAAAAVVGSVSMQAVEAAPVVRSRVPAVMVLLTPPGRSLTVSLPALIDAATEAMNWRTDLQILSPEQAGVDPANLARCGARRRMTCWATAIDARLKQETKTGDRARFAFIIVGQPSSQGRDRLYTLFMDVEASMRAYRSAPRSDPDWRERVEDQIFRSTPQSPPALVDGARPNRLTTYFRRVLRHTLRDRLQAGGHWFPSGLLRVLGAPAGLPILVDRQAVGFTGAGATEIAPLRAGLREVVVRGPDDHEVREVVQVAVGADVAVRWEPPPAGPNTARVVTRWGGLGVVAAGAVVAGLGFARASEVDQTCIVRSGEANCRGIGAPTFGFDPDQAPTTDPNRVNPSGVQISSLGLALVATGATWSAGSWLIGDDDSPPWWTWLAGLAIGGATYAVAAAAQGG